MTTTEELSNRQFVLQHNNRGYRCISWHPHFIETPWKKTREYAITLGDMAVEEYWSKSSNGFCDDCDLANPKCNKCIGS